MWTVCSNVSTIGSFSHPDRSETHCALGDVYHILLKCSLSRNKSVIPDYSRSYPSFINVFFTLRVMPTFFNICKEKVLRLPLWQNYWKRRFYVHKLSPDNIKIGTYFSSKCVGSSDFLYSPPSRLPLAHTGNGWVQQLFIRFTCGSWKI